MSLQAKRFKDEGGAEGVMVVKKKMKGNREISWCGVSGIFA